jgi:hypothetical protein
MGLATPEEQRRREPTLTKLAVTEEERREDSHKKCVSPERRGVHEVSV